MKNEEWGLFLGVQIEEVLSEANEEFLGVRINEVLSEANLLQ